MEKNNPVALSTRDKVFLIEDEMRKYPQLDLPVKDHFSDGVYGRELFIPAGTLLTGEIHKYRQLNVLVAGDISVHTEDGIRRVQAPFIVVSPAGTKRIAYAHTDCVWLTVHGTHETDLGKIKEKFIAQNDAEYSAFLEQTKLKELTSCPG